MNGNMLVDMQEAMDQRTVECPECDGMGYRYWRTLDNGMDLMADAIAAEFHHLKVVGRHPDTLGEMLEIAREIRHRGMKCERCEGKGEI